MIRLEKKELVSQLKSDLQNIQYVCVVIFKKTDVLMLESFRKSLRKIDATLRFVKKSLITRVFSDSSHNNLSHNVYAGQCALILSDNPFFVSECAKNDTKMNVLFMSSLVSGNVFQESIGIFKRCKDSSELYGMLVGMLQLPSVQLLSVLHQYTQSQS